LSWPGKFLIKANLYKLYNINIILVLNILIKENGFRKNEAFLRLDQAISEISPKKTRRKSFEAALFQEGRDCRKR
jgi:hypothetical protein